MALGRCKQFPANQPTHCRLHGALRNADAFGKFPVGDLHGRISSLLFRGQPEIYEETDRPPVVPDQIAHQHFNNVVIEGEHGYINR